MEKGNCWFMFWTNIPKRCIHAHGFLGYCAINIYLNIYPKNVFFFNVRSFLCMIFFFPTWSHIPKRHHKNDSFFCLCVELRPLWSWVLQLKWYLSYCHINLLILLVEARHPRAITYKMLSFKCTTGISRIFADAVTSVLQISDANEDLQQILWYKL